MSRYNFLLFLINKNINILNSKIYIKSRYFIFIFKMINNGNTIDNQLKLKEEIIEEEIEKKNYNKEKFLQYLLDKKENGNKLENWSLIELNFEIMNFINSINKNSKQSFQGNIIGNNITLNQKNLNINNPLHSNNEISLSKNPLLNKFHFSEENINNSIYLKEINCKTLEKTPLNDKNLKVIIQNPKINNSNIWESIYIIYEIVTDEMKWLVHRRYSDFENLRQVLLNHFPRLFIPPLPGKKLGNRRFDKDFIEKRMIFLQMFIDNVMNNEVFKTNEALYAFLSFDDRNKYDNKIKEMLSFNPSNYVNDYRTLNGKLIIYKNDSNEYDEFYKNLLNYFKLENEYYNNINYNLKNFYINISAACKNLDVIKDDFINLKMLNEKFVMKDDIIKSLEELHIFIKNWKRNLFNQNEIIKNKIKDFFIYQKMQNISFSELIIKRNEIKLNYSNENNKLNQKKEKLYLLMDINKWEIQKSYEPIDEERLLKDKNYAMKYICTKETLNVENLHNQLGYANKSIDDELKKFIDLNSLKIVENIKNFANEIYPTLTDSINIWATLNNYI